VYVGAGCRPSLPAARCCCRHHSSLPRHECAADTVFLPPLCARQTTMQEFTAQEIPKVLDCGPEGNVVRGWEDPRACGAPRWRSRRLPVGAVTRCCTLRTPPGETAAPVCGCECACGPNHRFPPPRPAPPRPRSLSTSPQLQCNLNEGGQYFKSTAQFL